MKIEVAYGRDIDDTMLMQLQLMEADAYACYERISSNESSSEVLIGAIPTDTLKQFKRRVASTLFFMKTQRMKHKEKKLVAMACISRRGKKDEMCFHTLYVKPMHRRRGIGKAIVKSAIAAVKKHSWHLHLNVNPLNIVAMKLYESLGFKTCCEQSLKMELLQP